MSTQRNYPDMLNEQVTKKKPKKEKRSPWLDMGKKGKC